MGEDRCHFCLSFIAQPLKLKAFSVLASISYEKFWCLYHLHKINEKTVPYLLSRQVLERNWNHSYSIWKGIDIIFYMHYLYSIMVDDWIGRNDIVLFDLCHQMCNLIFGCTVVWSLPRVHHMCALQNENKNCVTRFENSCALRGRSLTTLTRWGWKCQQYADFLLS